MRASTLGILLALAGAVLFGLVSVAARASTLPPLILGAYAYLLAGALLVLVSRGAPIARRDWGKVAVMALVGGALAPALLFFGLQSARASDASILLTLEMVFTALLAALFLRERVRAAGWGIDNTVSARLVGAYPPAKLVAIKGLLGGGAALAAALALRQPMSVAWPELRYVAYIGILGVAASILLFYHALRRLGATVTSGLFLPATALAGVAGGWFFLREDVTALTGAAAIIALVGAVLVARASAPQKEA